MRTYSDLPNAKILEVGSLNVNGCLRDAAEPTTHYIGLDLEEGPGVDFVITPGTDFPVEDDSFDLVMASSVFEHDSRFWDTFVRMCRAARPGGHIYVNAPSNGTVHRYPRDCWRFYPDAGLALAEHARSEGLEIDLCESFVGNRHSDVWNDFVAVFRKGPSAEPLNTAFIYHRYPSINARTWQSRAVYNESDATEDMSLITNLRSRCDNLTEQSQTQLTQISTLERTLGQRQEELDRLTAKLSEKERVSEHTEADNTYMVGQIATLESNLRQRKEEIEQAWSQVSEITAERDKLRYRIEILETTQSEFEKVQNELSKMEAAADFRQQQFEEQAELNRHVLTGVGRLKGLETAPNVLHVQTERLQREWRAENHPLTDLAGLLHKVGQSIHDLAAQKETQQEIEEKQALAESLASVLQQKAGLHQNVERLIERLEDREFALREAQEHVSTLTETLNALRVDTAKSLEAHHAESQEKGRALSALEGQLTEKDCALSELEEQLTEKDRALYILEEQLTEKDLTRFALEDRATEMSRMLHSLEMRVDQKDRQLSWLRCLYEFIEANEMGWKSLLPGHRERMTRALQRKGHFDADAYLSRYADVAESRMDPLRHYILHGMPEGRQTNS